MHALSQITAFVEIARRQSVSRAAEALFISQPALTARLKGLEADLGAQLFVRTPARDAAHGGGQRVPPLRGPRARDASRTGGMQRERPRARRRRPARDRRGARGLDLRPPRAPQALLGAATRASSVSVRTGHSEEVLDLVLREQVDARARPRAAASGHRQHAALRGPRHPRRRARPPLRRPDAHPPERDLTDEQLVLFDRTSSYTELTSALFVTAGVSPAGRHGARQHRRGQEDGRAGLRRRAPAPDVRRATSSRRALLAEVEVVDAEPGAAQDRRHHAVGTRARPRVTAEGVPRHVRRDPRRAHELAASARRKASSRGRATSTVQSSGPRSAPVSATRSDVQVAADRLELSQDLLRASSDRAPRSPRLAQLVEAHERLRDARCVRGQAP